MSKFKTIHEIHDAFDRKTLSPVELTRDYLNAIKASKHNAYLTVCEDRAMAQAKQADRILASEGRVPRDRLPLLGIPLAIKDNLVIDGVKTTCASRMLENYIPPYTATCVQRLESAGSVTLGKTNLDEFAMGGSNENSAFGAVEHPTHPGYVPGGSSGGSATAVGAGLCVAALGSDTGGSIRLPAHFSGIVGMKPTYGRVSRYGLVAFGSSLDQVGPMARSVEDAATVLRAMSGHDPMDSTSSAAGALTTKTDFSWKGLRIGVPAEYFVDGISPAVEKAVRDSLKWCESQGAKLVPISLPHTKYSVSIYYLVAVSEASSNLARFDGIRFGVRPAAADSVGDLNDFYKKVRARFGAEVKRRIILGTFALSSGYYDAYYNRACQVRRLVKNDFDQAFEKVDVIAAPVSPSTAFKIGEKFADPLKMYLNDILTIPANLAGLPAISVPCGKDSATGLSIGMHWMSPLCEDEALLASAGAFERGYGVGGAR